MWIMDLFIGKWVTAKAAFFTVSPIYLEHISFHTNTPAFDQSIPSSTCVYLSGMWSIAMDPDSTISSNAVGSLSTAT